MSETKIKARLYIDGNFTVHIHKYLAKEFGKTIDWKNFQEYVKNTIEKEEAAEGNAVRCLLESHFFVGTGTMTTDSERDYLFNTMEHARITKHATPLKQKVSGGLKEEAVDTNMVFFATQDYYKRERYGYLVLLAGDSDFVPLVTGLAKDEGVKAFLLYMNFDDKELGSTRTAQTLLESTDIQVDIETLRREPVDEKIKSIFVDYKPQGKSAASSAQVPQNSAQDDMPSAAAEENTAVKDTPFTEKQLTEAIKEVQNGRNKYVLLSQVGKVLCSNVGKKFHGKVLTTIKEAFLDDFDLDDSENGQEKIRLKSA